MSNIVFHLSPRNGTKISLQSSSLIKPLEMNKTIPNILTDPKCRNKVKKILPSKLKKRSSGHRHRATCHRSTKKTISSCYSSSSTSDLSDSSLSDWSSDSCSSDPSPCKKSRSCKSKMCSIMVRYHR